MKICYLYLQLRICTGYPNPNLNFEAPFLEDPKNIATVSEESIGGTHHKRSRNRKISTPRSIDIKNLSAEERREIFHRIKGRRNNRELVVEDFYLKKDQEGKMSLNGEDSVAEGDAASSSKQEICFVCDDNTAGRRNSSLSLNHSSEELNTFLIPHLPHSNAVPCPSNPQMFPPEDEEMESVTDDAVASRQVGATASRSLEGVTSPSLQHPYRSITYFSGNPAVVITRGIIQIFKSNNKVHVDEDKFLPHTDTLIMLAVPASVNAHGVIEFTSAFCDCIIRMQIIRDRTPNQYMVLLKFASPADAFNCYMSLNNQPYRPW